MALFISFAKNVESAKKKNPFAKGKLIIFLKILTLKEIKVVLKCSLTEAKFFADL